MFVKYIVTFLCFIVASNTFSQEILPKDFWVPRCKTNPPIHFLSYQRSATLDYGINSKSTINEIGDGSSEIKSNQANAIDLKFPVFNKQKFILTGSLNYSSEEIYFDGDENIDYPLYASLNDRDLKTFGGTLNGMIRLKGNKSLILRGSMTMAGDFWNYEDFPMGKYLKSSFAAAYAIKKNDDLFYAFGMYYGYQFGTPSVYPAFIWSQRFTNNYGIDAILPQRIRIWKMVNQNFFIDAYAKVTGDSYTIHLGNSILSGVESLQLRKSSILISGGVSHKISKWIWAEAKIGYSKSINFNLSESNFSKGSSLPKPDNNYIIKSTVRGAKYFSVSLFLSPPTEFLQKFRK